MDREKVPLVDTAENVESAERLVSEGLECAISTGEKADGFTAVEGAREPEGSVSEALSDGEFAEIAATADKLARKKARAVVRDMLRQRGVDGQDAEERLLSRWDEAGQEKDAEAAALREENAELRLQLEALARGVPGGRLDSYLRVAREHMRGGLDAGGAMDRALEEFPLPVVQQRALPGFAAETAAGRGSRALNRTEIDAMTPQELSERWDEVERFLQGADR